LTKLFSIKKQKGKTFIYIWDFLVQLIDDTFVLALFSFEAKKEMISNKMNPNIRIKMTYFTD
jgi:hypothetical protein